MKWAKPTGSIPPRVEEPCSTENEDLNDFNAPLSEDCARGGTIVADDVVAERAIDVQDTEEAERRLADPNDRAVPFKRTR